MNLKFGTSLFLLSSLIAISSSFCSYAQEVKIPHPEQYMLKVGQERHANIFIDSTTVPAELDKPEIPAANVKTNLGVVVTTASNFHWDTLELVPNTFLLWQEPDAMQIATAFAQGQGYGTEPVTLSRQEMTDAIVEYIQKAELKQGRGNSYQFRFSDVPEQLQEQLIVYIVNQLVNDPGPNYAHLWLNDEFWSNARIYYSPAPKIARALPMLAAVNWLERPEGTFRVYLNVNQGIASAGALKVKTADEMKAEQDKVTAEPTKGLPKDKLRLFRLDEVALPGKPVPVVQDGPPLYVPIVGGTKGLATKVVKSSLLNPKMPVDAMLDKTLTLEENRTPLSQVISKLEQAVGIKVQIDEDILAENYLLSCRTEGISASDAMRAIARLYGVKWEKTAEGAYRLSNAKILPIDKDLVRIGTNILYRFRDWNADAINKRDAEFLGIAREIVDELGMDALKYPGIPFSSLAPERQKKLRDIAKLGLVREIIFSQLAAFNYSNQELSFEYESRYGTLRALMPRMALPIRLYPAPQLVTSPLDKLQNDMQQNQ